MKWNDARKVLPAFIDGVYSREVLIRVKSLIDTELDGHKLYTIKFYVAALHCDDDVEESWKEESNSPVYFKIAINGIQEDPTFDDYKEQCLRAYLDHVTHWADIEEPEGFEV
jgi:hypothetical protein